MELGPGRGGTRPTWSPSEAERTPVSGRHADAGGHVCSEPRGCWRAEPRDMNAAAMPDQRTGLATNETAGRPGEPDGPDEPSDSDGSPARPRIPDQFAGATPSAIQAFDTQSPAPKRTRRLVKAARRWRSIREIVEQRAGGTSAWRLACADLHHAVGSRGSDAPKLRRHSRPETSRHEVLERQGNPDATADKLRRGGPLLSARPALPTSGASSWPARAARAARPRDRAGGLRRSIRCAQGFPLPRREPNPTVSDVHPGNVG